MKTILSGIIVIGLLGCGEVSSKGNTEESSADESEKQVSAETEKQTGRQRKKSIIHRKTREIVNANEAVKDPNSNIVKLAVQGNNPLTQAVTVYGKAAAMAGTIPIQQWIKEKKIVEDHTPTYAELQEWLKKNPSFELPVLPYQRMYGYDETTGEIVILEKRDEQ